MGVLITIITFVIILVILVIAHELGHFLTAKARGVGVIEFGIGFPPRIWGIKKGETIYSINALPLGGFVKLAGEEDPKIERSLAGKGYGTRILVLAAGSLVNILLPLVLFSIAFMIPHNIYIAPVTIEEVAPNSPAAIAGIEPGDRILSVNGETINNSGDMRRLIQLNLGKEISITLEHASGQQATVDVIPRWKPPAGQGSVGILMAASAEPPVLISKSEPIWRAVPLGFKECYETLVIFKNEIINWVIGATSPQVTGVVGMAQLTGEVAKAGFSPLLEFAAFISINLGIVNLLPLPALDGGRIVFVLLEIIRRGKRITPRVEGLVHLVGFAILIGLMLVVTYGDISKIITTGSAIP